MPESSTPDGMLAQILLEQGKLATNVALIQAQLANLPDHEQRIRGLERFRYQIGGAVVVLSAGAGFLGALAGHLVR